MGVKGAAIATVISSMLMMVWVIFHFIYSKHKVITLYLKNISLSTPIIMRIVAIGMAPFVMQIASSIVYGVFNKQLITYGGDLAVGAMGIINSVSTMVVMTIISITIAMQPIIGFNFGAENHSRVRSTLLKSMLWASVISVLTWIIVQAFPQTIIMAFNTDSQKLIEIGTTGMKIYLLALPVVGFQIVSSSYFQAIGKAKISVLLTLLRQVVFLIPLLFILPLKWDLPGLWAAGPISNIMSLIVVTFFIIPEIIKLKEKTFLVNP
jgi:Na+-driven multidrug efflux pump